MTIEHRPVDRRKFFQATAGAAAGLAASSYANVAGSNSRVNVGLIGCGGRAQAHIDLLVKMALDNRGVAPVAVCDVWYGVEEEYEHTFGGTATRRKYSQGLYPSAKKCGLNPGDKTRVVTDYRRLLERNDVDAVCIAAPDHWHARMTLDAFAAGKDVYVERPMARTAAEAVAVCDAAKKSNRVLSVGLQTLADPVWRCVRERVQAGRIGHVSQLQAGVYRNDIRGHGRYYRLVSAMNPKTIDWDLFLGHRFEIDGIRIGPTPQEKPFDRATFAQWRCEREFGGGPIAELLLNPLSRMLAATTLRFPTRVIAGGGLFLEHDGRTVPDLATLIADFDDGVQIVLTAATTSGYPQEDVIRGRNGAVKFLKGGFQILHDDPRGGAGLPARIETTIRPVEFVPVNSPKNDTEALWENFLDCVRRRDANTLAPSEMGLATTAIAEMAERSLLEGRAFGWDGQRREIVPADAAWLAKHPPRVRIDSTEPPDYMTLAGSRNDG